MVSLSPNCVSVHQVLKFLAAPGVSARSCPLVTRAAAEKWKLFSVPSHGAMQNLKNINTDLATERNDMFLKQVARVPLL